MQTFLPVETLTDEERTTEAAGILATGLIRLRSAPKESDFSLDFLPAGSVHDAHGSVNAASAGMRRSGHDRYHDGEKQR